MYQRSRDIEQRLQDVVRLIRSGKFSTPSLAMHLGVSIPTVSRYVTALRGRGTIFDPNARMVVGGMYWRAADM